MDIGYSNNLEREETINELLIFINRLDILIKAGLISKVNKSDIIPGYDALVEEVKCRYLPR